MNTYTTLPGADSLGSMVAARGGRLVATGAASNGNSTAVASTDLGHAPDVDSSVEHLIANAATSLRILADQARECARHKQAAHEGWAQVRALQNYTGYMAAAPQWQQQQPHSPNGYHAM